MWGPFQECKHEAARGQGWLHLTVPQRWGGGGGAPGEGGQEKERGGGGESARLHPDPGGAGREPSPQPASRPRSTCACRTWLSNEEPRNPRARPLRFPSGPSGSPAPPHPSPAPGSWAGPRARAGPGPPRGGEQGARVAGATGGRSSLCNGAGWHPPMRWQPRLVLNENKRSTWARLRSHVSPPGRQGAVGVLPGAESRSPSSPSAAPCCRGGFPQ